MASDGHDPLPWVDVWEPSGDWTRALARYLGSREYVRQRVEYDEFSAIDEVAFRRVARIEGAFTPVSLLVADGNSSEKLLRMVHRLRRYAQVGLMMVVLRAAQQDLAADVRAAGAMMVFDEFWQAKLMARLVRCFFAQRQRPVLSLEAEIWKNLPWNNVLCHDADHEV